MNTKKKAITFRLKQDLLKKIDTTRILSHPQSRTAFVETACSLYADYLNTKN